MKYEKNALRIPPPSRKRVGSGLLIMALVGAVVVSVTSLSLAKVNSVAINCMAANKVALQAHQYAASKGELVRATKYDELAAQARQDIQNSEFQDEIIVGAETDYPGNDTIKQKICTINVYKAAEALPRSSLIVTRLSAQPDSGIPKGSIIPWYGILGNIPSGFALCDGSNGTPDLRDRFIVGAGNSYNLSAIGGAKEVTLTIAQMPSHAHTRGTMNITGAFSAHCIGYGAGWGNGAFYTTLNGDREAAGEGWSHHSPDFHFDASRNWTGETSYVGGSQAHENRPPYFALYYIMKV